MAYEGIAAATPRHGIALVLLLLLGMSAGLALACNRGDQAVAPVYTVSRIRAVLAHRTARWVGRAVRVRGILEGPFVFCGASRPCPPPTLGLIDDETEFIGPDGYLPVLAGPPVQPWAFLRRLPLLNRFTRAPQRLRFGLMAPYRLRLRAAPGLCRHNRDVLCYVGVIEDASPGSS